MVAFLSGKSKRTFISRGAALTLCSSHNTPLVTFSPEVIDGYRRMITGLLYRETLPQRISIVSALREEGVTYTALALATTLANDLPARICVVELNWWQPGLQMQLVPPEEPANRPGKKRTKKARDHAPPALPAEVHSAGMAGVLAGQATIDEVLLRTHLPNLALLPAGILPLEDRPVVARSGALCDIIEQLGQRFDHLLLDVPAILASSDAVALASFGNACLVVVRQGVTSVGIARRALDEVKHLPMLGVVLNRTKIRMPRWIYSLIPQD